MSRPMYYILVDRKPQPVSDVDKWSEFYHDFEKNRKVGFDSIGGVDVSTVFLGLDHSWNDDPLPILFETMIFGGEYNDYQERCSTWEEAEEMHKRAVQKVFDSLGLEYTSFSL